MLLDQPGRPQDAGLDRELDILFRAELAERGMSYADDGFERARMQRDFALEMIREHVVPYLLIFCSVGLAFLARQ